MTQLLSATGIIVEVEGKRLLDKVSLSVAPGERVALLGPNGAGKSTLLDVLSGVRTPAAGHVTLCGKPMVSLKRHEVARSLAMVPQREQLPDDLTVIEAVLMGRAPHQTGFGIPGDIDIAICRKALVEVDLGDFDGREVGTLSGGERQRVIMARALAQQPQVMLLDEPTSALDLRHALQVARLTADWAVHDVAVITTVHDLNQVARFADRAIILHGGQVVVDDPVALALTPERLEPIFGLPLLRLEVEGRPVLVAR